MKKILAILVVVVLMVAFSAPAMAVGSVSGDPAPAVVPYDPPKGTTGTETQVKTTPVTDAEKGTTAEDKAIVEAYDSIKDAESLTALIPGLDKVVAALDSSLNADELVVHDLFGITAEGDTAASLAKGEAVTFSVKSDLKPGDVLVVVQYVNGKWVALDPSAVVINADGSVSVTVSSAAPIAFLTKGA